MGSAHAMNPSLQFIYVSIQPYSHRTISYMPGVCTAIPLLYRLLQEWFLRRAAAQMHTSGDQGQPCQTSEVFNGNRALDGYVCKQSQVILYTAH